MQVNLAYGKTGHSINLDDSWNVTVIEQKYLEGLPDPKKAIQFALNHPIDSEPLSKLVKPGDRVGIIFNDITRATPNKLLVQAVLDEINMPPENITLFNALGTHRKNSDEEIAYLLGDEIVQKYRIVQNDAFDKSTQSYLGKNSFGNDIWINTELINCDVRILTGFIEPSDIAGFSGGGKAIMPGMAGLSMVINNHGVKNISHPNATWAKTTGNPIWDEISEVANLVGASFLLNVTMNKDHEVTGVFAGSLNSAHTEGCNFVRASAMVPVTAPYDAVVTTNSGYPLDINLYQCVKGMGAAAQIVKPGGSIILVAECLDGIPDHGLYKQLLHDGGSPQGVLDLVWQPGFSELDQWEGTNSCPNPAESGCLCVEWGPFRCANKGDISKPIHSVELTLAELIKKYGPETRICVLPEGPQTIPYLVEN